MVAPPLLVSCRPSLQTTDLYNRVVRTLNVDYLAARLFSCQDLVIAYFNLTLFDGRYVPLGFETCWNEVNIHWTNASSSHLCVAIISSSQRRNRFLLARSVLITFI
jgi:hypothetical protein